MATLYRYAGKAQWYARFNDSDGKRVSRATGTESKREARAIANALEAKERDKRRERPHLGAAFSTVIEAAAREASAGELTLARSEQLIRRLHQLANPGFRVVSLQEHLNGWLNSQAPHVTSKTLATYSDMARRIAGALGPRKASEPVGELTKEDVEAALIKITRTPIGASRRSKSNGEGKESPTTPSRTVSAATANMDLAALRRALRVAVEQGLAKANAAESVRPLPQTDSSERAPFTLAEVRKLIDGAPTEDWAGAILIAAHTGLRLGDVIRLNRRHVVDGRIIIRPEKTKRARETISVPLTPPCLRWIGERGGDFFPSLIGTKTGTLSTQFVRIMERAGVPREVIEAGDVAKRRSFHSLRHTFASWLAEADIHADVRQRLTGHKSAGVHGRYSHFDGALERAVAKLPAI